jgi:carbamate kinase
MGPKIEAARRFIAHGGQRAVITSSDTLEQALAGKTGTEIVP